MSRDYRAPKGEEWVVLTPRLRNGKRLRLQVRPSEAKKVERGGAWTAIITDRDGFRWRFRGASCGLPRCFCDAIAVLLTKPADLKPKPPCPLPAWIESQRAAVAMVGAAQKAPCSNPKAHNLNGCECRKES